MTDSLLTPSSKKAVNANIKVSLIPMSTARNEWMEGWKEDSSKSNAHSAGSQTIWNLGFRNLKWWTKLKSNHDRISSFLFYFLYCEAKWQKPNLDPSSCDKNRWADWNSEQTRLLVAPKNSKNGHVGGRGPHTEEATREACSGVCDGKALQSSCVLTKLVSTKEWAGGHVSPWCLQCPC